MKLFITKEWCHHKNLQSILRGVKSRYDITIVDTISEASVVWIPSGETGLSPRNYPDKKFILGPHFSTLPGKRVLSIDNTCNNAVYIQPSEWAVNVWKELGYTNTPLHICPFGIDTNKFNVTHTVKDLVLVYFKYRNTQELSNICYKLQNSNIPYKILEYGTYKESDYIQLLKRTKYMIIVGSSESQGFALQEAMSCNVPLYVWNVTRFREYKCEKDCLIINTPITTIPYFDERCGDTFIADTFSPETFDYSKYKPREFILENLADYICMDIFINILQN